MENSVTKAQDKLKVDKKGGKSSADGDEKCYPYFNITTEFTEIRMSRRLPRGNLIVLKAIICVHWYMTELSIPKWLLHLTPIR